MSFNTWNKHSHSPGCRVPLRWQLAERHTLKWRPSVSSCYTALPDMETAKNRGRGNVLGWQDSKCWLSRSLKPKTKRKNVCGTSLGGSGLAKRRPVQYFQSSVLRVSVSSEGKGRLIFLSSGTFCLIQCREQWEECVFLCVRRSFSLQPSCTVSER